MVSGLNASGLQFVTNVNDLQQRLSKVQQELSSGLKVNDASDAPDQVSAILGLHASIQRNQQVRNNLTAVKGDATTADQTLGTAITLMDEAATAAAQALGMNQTAETRATLSSRVADLMQNMVSLSQTQVEGRYIFSGDADQTPSYQYDTNSPTGVDRLQVSASTRQVEDGNGNLFPVSRSANQIFDARDSSDAPTSDNVFAALNTLRVALANNDPTGIQNGLDAVNTASEYLNQQQAFYGNVENRVTNALSDAGTAAVSYQQDLSNRQDADATQAIVEMQQYITSLQAAMAAQAKMPNQTLFNLI